MKKITRLCAALALACCTALIASGALIASPAAADPFSDLALRAASRATQQTVRAEVAGKRFELAPPSDYGISTNDATLSALKETRPGEVTLIPASTFSDATILAVAAAIAGALYKLIERMMGPFSWAARLARLDQILTNYIKGAIVKIVAKYPTLTQTGVTVVIHNDIIAQAVNDIIKVIPKWLVSFAGGPAALEDKVRNRLPDVLRDVLPTLVPRDASSVARPVSGEPQPKT